MTERPVLSSSSEDGSSHGLFTRTTHDVRFRRRCLGDFLVETSTWPKVEEPASACVCCGELEIVATVNCAITSSSLRTKVNGPRLTISNTTLPFQPAWIVVQSGVRGCRSWLACSCRRRSRYTEGYAAECLFFFCLPEQEAAGANQNLVAPPAHFVTQFVSLVSRRRNEVLLSECTELEGS